MRLQLQSLLTQYWQHWQQRCMRMPVERQELTLASRNVWKQTNLVVPAVSRFAPLPTTSSYMVLMAKEVLKVMLAVEEELLAEYNELSVTAAIVELSGVRVASAVQVESATPLLHFTSRHLYGFSKLLRKQVPLVPFWATRTRQQRLIVGLGRRQRRGMVKLQALLLQVRSRSQSSESHIRSAEKTRPFPDPASSATETSRHTTLQFIQIMQIDRNIISMEGKDKRSKVYIPNGQSIPMNNDHSHQKLTLDKVEEAKHVQERRQIDKMLQAIVKERLFGNLLEDQNKLSSESVYNIDLIHRNNFSTATKSIHTRSRQGQHYDLTSRQASLSHHYTIDTSRTCLDRHNEEFQREKPKKRNYSQKLPMLLKKQEPKADGINMKGPIFHTKKLEINEKALAETFKKWAGPSSSGQLVYEIKVTRENIVNKCKNLVDGRLIERFFHFFSFPLSFGLRQFSNLLENAANCNLKFIYFWVFSILDDVNNGILTSQDLFQFMQKFPEDNPYIEKEVYDIQRYLQQLERAKKESIKRQIGKQGKESKEGQVLVEEMLVMNHNLRLEELIVLLKQSNKEMIDVACVKNTCYHQTILSLQHDPLQRVKKNQIERSEIQTKRLKMEALEAKKKLKTLIGLRLRDFYQIYGTKRPRLFCFFLNLLAGVRASDYE